jgi:uncharacterized protein
MLTAEQIKQTVSEYFRDKPVKKVYLFGSYARGEATEESDVDLLLEIVEDAAVTYFTLGGYLADMRDRFQRKVDIVTVDALRDDRYFTKFVEAQKKELYVKPD